jgi:AraC-like DNA-binding protein
MTLHLFFSAFLFLSALQGMFLSFIIYRNIDKNRHEKYFIIIVTVFFSLNLMANESIRFIFGSTSDLRMTPFAFLLLLGPAFYHYCRNSILKESGHKPGDIVKFLPFSAYVVFIMLAKLTGILAPLLEPVGKFVCVFIMFELVFYVIIIRSMLSRYEKNLEDNLSDKADYSLKWFKHIASAVTVIVVIYFVLLILDFHLLADDTVMEIYSLLLAVMIYLFGYKGLTQKTLMFDGKKARYAKSPLSKEYTEYWKEKLLNVMENDRPYLDADLTLLKLAEQVGTSDKILSQIINCELGSTFYDLVNGYRIEEVKKILSSDSGMNILDSAFASGFNSKTAFNTLFKKKTGVTPTQFMRNMTR